MPPKSAKTKDRNKKNVKAKGKQNLVPPIESEDDSTTCDAILVTRSELGEEETIKADAKNAFEQALNEELYVEAVEGEIVVRNHRGLGLAGLSTRFQALEEKFAAQEEKVTTHEAEIAELKDQVLTLRLSLKEYRTLASDMP